MPCTMSPSSLRSNDLVVQFPGFRYTTSSSIDGRNSPRRPACDLRAPLEKGYGRDPRTTAFCGSDACRTAGRLEGHLCPPAVAERRGTHDQQLGAASG